MHEPNRKPALARVNKKDATVRKIRSEDDLPLEIPEENIKTLLTLGFMSSLAFNVTESDEGKTFQFGRSNKVFNRFFRILDRVRN